MIYVYALYNRARDVIYIGYTADLDKRIARHNGQLASRKKSFTSKQSGQWELVYKEEHPTRDLAMKREKQLKSAQGRKFVRNLLL